MAEGAHSLAAPRALTFQHHVLPLGLAVLLWAVSALSFALRPILPVDETRYLTVAWEMWRGGDWLVPHLNGAPYSHKPPLLFWLINLMWSVSGPSATAARLVTLASGAAGALLTGLIARQLWPDLRGIGTWAVVILAGTGLFTVYAGLVMFDGLLTVGVLLSTLGLLLVWRRARRRWWLLVAFGIGIGLLAKGPVDLLHVLAVAALAPLWMMRNPPGGWRGWYGGLALSVLGGAAMVLAWAVPAALAGGAEYGTMIFWGQTAGRVAHAFAHARPWWFYLALLPLLAYPWGWWPAFWRGLRRGGWRGLTPELRFCVIWFGALLAAFSLLSGKQVHYLLPALPALALIAARQTIEKAVPVRRRDLLAPLSLMLLVALAPLALDLVARTAALPAALPAEATSIAGSTGLWACWALLGVLATLFLLTPVRAKAQAASIAAGWTATVLMAHVVAAPTVLGFYDWSRVLPELQRHAPCGIAWLGGYEGEVGFLARLERPVTPLAPEALDGWLAAHPGGLAVNRSYDPATAPAHAPDRLYDYRGRKLALWIAAGPPSACR